MGVPKRGKKVPAVAMPPASVVRATPESSPRIEVLTVPLILQFLGGIGLLSWLIEYFSLGPLSHVDAVDRDGRLMGARSDRFIGADDKPIPAGLERRPPDYYGRVKRRVRMTLQVDQAKYDAYWAWLDRHKGDPYNLRGIVAMAEDRHWSSRRALFCSQAQGLAGESSVVYPQLYTPANRLTPVELATVWSGLGAHTETLTP